MNEVRRELVASVIVIIGVVVLLAGAGLHLFAGYPAISQLLHQSNLQARYIDIFQLLFLLAGLHWIIASGIALVALFSSSPRRGLFIALAAVFPLLDGIALFLEIGIFIGNIMLVIAGGLLIIGAIVLSGQRFNEKRGQ